MNTTVLLCSELENLGSGLNLEEVRRWLKETDLSVRVQILPELCHRPGEIKNAIPLGGAIRIVMGLCSRDYAELELHAHLRRAGLDPMGVETVNLGAHCALVHPRHQGTEKAKILLASAVARARAFRGSRPEHLKPQFAWVQKVSRRSLFSLPPLHYEAVPSINGERCIAGTGCDLCIQICPCGALEQGRGRVWLRKANCEGCGLCVTACPRGAIEFPIGSLIQLEAQVSALLNPSLGTLQPRGILFLCSRSAQVLEEQVSKGLYYPAGWLPVQLPCLGMVSAAWPLQCLTLGMGGVCLLSCPPDCAFGQRETIEGRAAYCREFLCLLGDSPDKVRILSPVNGVVLAGVLGNLPEGKAISRKGLRPQGFFSSLSEGARALLDLAEDSGAPVRLSLAHPYSPFGLVDFRTDLCTGCGVCATVCPSGALGLERDMDGVSLTFDATLCTGCGLCVSRCPEARDGVLQTRRITDLYRLSLGRVTLYQDRDARCEACGASIATKGMLKRISGLLGAELETTSALITRYCPSCRGEMAVLKEGRG